MLDADVRIKLFDLMMLSGCAVAQAKQSFGQAFLLSVDTWAIFVGV